MTNEDNRNFKINEQVSITIDLDPIFEKGVWIKTEGKPDFFLNFEEFKEIQEILKDYF